MKVNLFDLEQSFLSGTFRIHNLTPFHSILNTYFEGKLIGMQHSFTENREDPDNWRRFKKWNSEYATGNATYDINESRHLYIKIKEQFLLPDPKITSVQGASIEGCYYCCYYKSLDCFAGFYACGDKRVHTAQQIILVRVRSRTSEEYRFA
ncbi:GID complex subunit 4 [Gurleya vavrai]